MRPESSRKPAWRRVLIVVEGGPCREVGPGFYLNRVLQLGVLVVEDAEAERLLGDHLHEHEVATLRGEQRQGGVACRGGDGPPKPLP